MPTSMNSHEIMGNVAPIVPPEIFFKYKAKKEAWTLIVELQPKHSNLETVGRVAKL